MTTFENLPEQRPWLNAYDPGIPADIDPATYASLPQMLEETFARWPDRPAYSYMGKVFSNAFIDRQSKSFAAYLQSLGLKQGDRVAIMLPNVIQYPIASAAILRAGMVLVNVNPLYTARELEHQLKDSGSKAILILENFASTLAQCVQNTEVKHIVVANMGECLGALKGALVNYVVRKVKKLVPEYSLPQAVPFSRAVSQGASLNLHKPTLQSEDIAVLQYTGGTTGPSKGATLLHRNLVANVLQAHVWVQEKIDTTPQGEQFTTVCALPLYHIFAFTVTLMMNRAGGLSILIPNPRDLSGMLKELSKHKIHSFPAVNTLYNGMLNHPDFTKVDWSHLRFCIGGGMAVQRTIAEAWHKKTGGAYITEAYGLSETSPLATANPISREEFTGTIGVPVSNTSVKCLDDAGMEVPLGQPGEIAIRGPQVMAGYWKQPDETAKVMTADGFFKSGDIGIMDERGFVRIVDRKKDMVLVSGFNAYPTEIEEVVAACPGVLECAAVGVADEKTGEAIKLFVVKKDPALTQESLRAYCEENLTGYKRPKYIEFRTELPKSPVGKILRRELREP